MFYLVIGLNQKADVSLISTFPRNKTDNTIIKDPSRLEKMGWPSKLERATAKMGARFLDFDLLSGTWSFRVQHFSKYGLADSDDECDENIGAGTDGPLKKPLGVLPVPTVQDKGDFLNGSKISQIGLGGGGLGGLVQSEMSGIDTPKPVPMEDLTNVIASPRESVSFLPTADSISGKQKIQVTPLSCVTLRSTLNDFRI